MSATLVLRQEHSALVRILRLMSTVSALAGDERGMSPRDLAEASGFLETFVSCHEEKEEELLFPAVMGSDAPVIFGVIGRLVSQHGESRMTRLRVEEIIRSSPPGQVSPDLPPLLSRYLVDTESHVSLEEQECFDVADRSLFPEVQDFLVEEYEAVERRRMGESGKARLDWMIAELESQAAAGMRG